MGTWQGCENWYGGRIQQLVHLERNPKNNTYAFKLEKLTYGRSNRLSRYFGSASVLQVSVEKKLRRDNDTMRGLLSTYLCLFGRIFMPIHAKDGKAHFVQCRMASMSKDVVNYPRVTKTELLDWYNPLREGDKQVSICHEATL